MREKRVVARHRGGLRFDVRTGTGHEFEADNDEGKGGPRPTELVLAALATCSGMDVAAILAKKRQPVRAYHVEVTGRQRDGRPDVFTWIEMIHVVEGPGVEETAVRRSIELSATGYCPVNAMLSAGPSEIHHRFLLFDTATSPPVETIGEVLITGPFRPVPVKARGAQDSRGASATAG